MKLAEGVVRHWVPPGVREKCLECDLRNVWRAMGTGGLRFSWGLPNCAAWKTAGLECRQF